MTVQNLLIKISAAFFPLKIMLVIRLSFSLFYLSYLSSKIWEVLMKYGYIKKDRKTMFVIDDEIKTIWPLLSQGYGATTRRKFTFYHSVPRSFMYSTDRTRKDERLCRYCCHPVVLNRGSLDWESSTLNTRSLLHELRTFQNIECLQRIWNVWLSGVWNAC